MGSWTHLVPSVGPGSPEVHARQRRILGRRATARVVLAQAGVLLVAIGVPGHDDRLVLPGTALVALYAATSVVLLAGALWPVVRGHQVSVRLVVSRESP